MKKTKKNINKFKPALTSAQFRKLSKPQQRVAIAKDAIAQIKLNQFIVSTGQWAGIAAQDDSQTVLDQTRLLGGLVVLPPPKCDCCALGACLLSSMRLANVLVLEGDADTEEVFTQLGRWFDEKQLDLIECAFEWHSRQDEGSLRHELTTEEFDAAIAFGNKYEDEPEKLALAIFQNIIRNKGTFKP